MTQQGAETQGHTEKADQPTHRVEQVFSRHVSAGTKAIMPFICGGYPTIDATRTVLPALARAGSSVVEVGIPFSDPIADGPVIASAMHQALEQGVRPQDIFDAVHQARESGGIDDLGIVAMISISLVWKLGIDRITRDMRTAGIDGVIIPDVPVEESEHVLTPMREQGLTASMLVAPTTPDERAIEIAQSCSGFVYLLARVGITGEGNSGQLIHLAPRVAFLKKATDLPIACGFGISTPDQVRKVVIEGGADAAIVGSALVKRMGRAAREGADTVREAESFVRSLRAGLS